MGVLSIYYKRISLVICLIVDILLISNVSYAAKVFIDNNIDVNVYASNCVKNDYYEGLKQALKQGADVNYKDYNKQNLVNISAGVNNHKTMEILLKNGADANELDSDGNNAYLLSAKNGDDKLIDTLFQYSKIKINTDILDSNGYTALMLAVNKGNIKSVQSLINHNSNVNFINKNKLSALLVLVIFGNDSVNNQNLLKLLISKHANINAKDNDGRSVAFYAKYRRLHKIAKILLDNGAKI